MAGKKKPGKKPTGHRVPSLPRPIAEAIDQAQAMIQRRRFDDALTLLRELDRRVPGNFMVLQLLAEAAYEMNDAELFLDASERLAASSPNDADFQAQRAFAHARMGFPFLAQRYFQQVAQRFPTHAKADLARQTLTDLEPAVSNMTRQMVESGIAEADVPELGARHEQVQVWLSRRKFSEARRVAAGILSRWPKFAPAWNNTAEAWLHEGNLAQAVAATRQALAAVPGNVHATANLVRFLLLEGKTDEARGLAAELVTMPVQHPDNRLKKAEALALLGDDEAVLRVWSDAEQEGFRLTDGHLAWLHHTAAVAAYRLGDEKRARDLWARCFKAAPTFAPASRCIDDLDEPAGEQNGPWVGLLDAWVPGVILDDLVRRCGGAAPAAVDPKVRDDLRRFLAQHPHVAAVAPMVFDRGDPLGRELMLRLCGAARTPELLSALKEFALSQRGPDRLRVQAALAVAGAGLLPQGRARLWLKGEWQERQVPTAEVTSEATGERLEPRVEKMLVQSFDAMHSGDGERAEQLITQALAQTPDSPTLLYNLANALRVRGRHEEAAAIVSQLRERYPDYLFAAGERAREHLRAGELDEAEGLLRPFWARPRLHVGEFRALALAELELAEARKDRETARWWARLMEAVDPNDPQLPEIRKGLGMRG